MKQIIISVIFFLTFVACNMSNQKKNETIVHSKKSIATSEKYYFEYDAIDYYKIDFDESKIIDLYDNESKSELDYFKKGIILENIPRDFSDLSFIDKLQKIGYNKSSINKSKFIEINKVFVEKKANDSFTTACIYVYRDILIFKKNSKVVGTAKICFECKANQITGTKANTEDFGMDGDYKKLSVLLQK